VNFRRLRTRIGHAHAALLVAFGTTWSVQCKSHEPQTLPPVVASPTEPSPTSNAPESSVEELAASSEEHDRECEVTIAAPIDRVRSIVTDYEHYATNLPKFGRSKVLKRTAGAADVYLQIPVLHGAANLWAVVRFAGPLVSSEGERVEGTYTGQGNVSAFHCLWTYARVDDTHTRLHLGLLLLPKLPLPHSVIESEHRDACKDAVNEVKSHAEANRAP
jgi:hypothetical protein